VSYCPKCGHEYADTVERCIECGRTLRKGRRPIKYDLEFEDLLIPVGAVVGGVVALFLLYLRIGAQFGWIKGPFATLIIQGQPACMTAFYAIAFVACTLVLAIWLLRLILKRG
jgi:hypothetical protein